MKLINNARYYELIEKEKELKEHKSIIENYYKEFEIFCWEYDIQMNYVFNEPSKNFAMIRKRFLEIVMKKQTNK